MRIIRFAAENVKRLKTVDITPAKDIVEITGENGSGKSSILDSIYYTLAGTKQLPSQPVRRGQKKAFARLELGDLTVTRRFTAEGGTSLSVESKDGAKYPSPQHMLDELHNGLSFDPLEFSRMEPKRQLETLKGLVKLSVDVDALDRQNQIDYAKRTEVNRKRDEAKAALNSVAVAEPGPGKPEDVQAIIEQIGEANARNAAIEKDRLKLQDLKRQREQQETNASDCLADVRQLLERVETLKAQAALHKSRADELKAQENEMALELGEQVDISELNAKLLLSQQVNKAWEKYEADRQRRDMLEGQVADLSDASEELTGNMEKRNEEKAQAISSAKMPVEGLGFGNGEVTFNGLPLEQASDAERLRISTAIAMAANPKLRVIRIRDGSLLDDKSFGLLEQMAREKDFQVWIETVTQRGKVAIEMYDGAVRPNLDSQGE